ncbi:type II secretion system F family protein [Trinickia acidisoli]|uniref:type II secretion system F family protein n=1 Tax=Trinickia acidisoli TaxID=2767482 RepID=UPI001A8C3B78|nr:type II secretion system F family protein [Trinickia acidisoli]
MSAANVFGFAVFAAVIFLGLIAQTAAKALRTRPAALMRARLATIDQAPGTVEEVAQATALFREPGRHLRVWARLDERLLRFETVGGKSGLRLSLAASVGSVFVALATSRIDVVPVWATAILAVLLPIVTLLGTFRFFAERLRMRLLNVFPDALDLMVRAVRTGVPVMRALEIVADECAPPIAGEFRQIADALHLGIELETVLASAMKRLRIPEFSFFCVALLLQRETGGPLGETLEGLADIIRARKDIKLKTRALTAESRLASRIIACVPLVIFGALYVINRDYVRVLTDTRAGHLILVTAASLLTFGLLVIQRLGRLDTSR